VCRGVGRRRKLVGEVEEEGKVAIEKPRAVEEIYPSENPDRLGLRSMGRMWWVLRVKKTRRTGRWAEKVEGERDYLIKHSKSGKGLQPRAFPFSWR
jgi:hypothetical protein